MATVRIPPNPDYGAELRDGHMVEKPATNARQAVTGHNVRYVLAISILGAVFILAVVYFLFFMG